MLIVYAAVTGLLASFFSSVFGGGFGLLSVPAIFWIITHFFPDMPHTMQMTIATGSLCSIPLGIVASYKQIKYHYFDKTLYKNTVIIMTLGALLGAYLATIISSESLRYIFAIIVFIAAVWMLIFNNNTKVALRLKTQLFKLLSTIIACLSTLTGVSVFTVPFFVLNGIDIKKAIGTSTVLVLTYSTIAGIWMILLGIPKVGISWNHFGYANLPIFLSALIPCLIGALLGAKLVKVLPSFILKRIFIAMMFCVSITMML